MLVFWFGFARAVVLLFLAWCCFWRGVHFVGGLPLTFFVLIERSSGAGKEKGEARGAASAASAVMAEGFSGG